MIEFQNFGYLPRLFSISVCFGTPGGRGKDGIVGGAETTNTRISQIGN